MPAGTMNPNNHHRQVTKSMPSAFHMLSKPLVTNLTGQSLAMVPLTLPPAVLHHPKPPPCLAPHPVHVAPHMAAAEAAAAAAVKVDRLPGEGLIPAAPRRSAPATVQRRKQVVGGEFPCSLCLASSSAGLAVHTGWWRLGAQVQQVLTPALERKRTPLLRVSVKL